MATKVTNKINIEKAVEKLGADAVNSAIKGAGLQTSAINALQGTNEGNTNSKINTSTNNNSPQNTEGVKGYKEGQVIIPGVNTSNIVNTENEVDKITKDVDGMGGVIIDKQQEALNQTDADKKKLEVITPQAKIDTETFAKQQEQAIIDQAKSTEVIVKDADADLKAIQDKQAIDAENRLTRDTISLENKKQEELSYLRSEQEYQRVQNENAITEAKTNIEIERQKSAWAYNKLGLGFSSGIINQSQQIATNGIAKIAEIKAKMNFDQATVALKISNAEFDYTKLINDNIDKQTDKIDTLKKEMSDRINTTKKSLLDNSFTKNQKVEEIRKWAREEKYKLEREHIDDMIKIQDRGIKLAQEIKATQDNAINIGKTNINDRISDGSLFSMSDIELTKLAQKAGITINEINSLKKTSIASAVSIIASSLLGKDYIIGEVNRNEINIKVNSLMQGGRTLQEATEIATKDTLKNTPEFKRIERAKELEAKVQEAQVLKLISGGGGRGGGGGDKGYIPKASDLDKNIEPNGDVYYTNKLTGQTFQATKKGIIPNYFNQTGDINGRGEIVDIPIKANITGTKKEGGGSISSSISY